VRADALPADKAAFIRDLQARGQQVAMVGDGINDGSTLGSR
jgi:Cu2+-exporting ATPase